MAGGISKLVIWRFFDGKPGHDRQSQGLVNALGLVTQVASYDFNVARQRISLRHFIQRELPFGTDAPDPDLIVGAGRRCQWPIVVARRARGGHSIYLMKPVLPTRWFDLCVIPRHDQPPSNARVIVSDGVLNDMVTCASRGDDGLLLVGGPSAHYAWDEAHLLGQIERVVADKPGRKWVVADSRRTPRTTIEALKSLGGENVSFVAHQDTDHAWLAQQLIRSAFAWVSSDSVSMVYEALTSGIPVGVLEVPAKRSDRITRIIDDLVIRGLVTSHTSWCGGTDLQIHAPLAEAARCARIIWSRWDPERRELRPEAIR